MAMLNFDASGVAPATGTMDAIPAGWYNVSMEHSEMKPTANGTGAFLACRFTVLDGQYAGRKLFSRLNLKNANPVAVEIAYKELSAIAHATGVIQVGESSDLHGIPFKAKVKVKAASGDYEASNEISAYRSATDPTAVVAGSVATPPARPAAVKPPVIAPAAVPAATWAKPAAAQPWAAAAPAVTDAVAPVVGKPVPIEAFARAAATTVVMTGKAPGASLESFLEAGWTVDQLVAEGYAKNEVPGQSPVVAPAVAATPAVAPAEAVVTANLSAVPPWAQAV